MLENSSVADVASSKEGFSFMELVRWVANIKMYLREIGWDGMDWIELALDRDQWRALVNTVMNIRVP
jgi:hypothetical protein